MRPAASPISGEDSFFARTIERGGISELADDTGGIAFYGNNGVAEAMARTLKFSSYYYTLSYDPEDKKWNGAYRSIRVQVAKPISAHLVYRRGYFAVGDFADARPNTQLDSFVEAMRPTTPSSTELLFKVSVLPRQGHPGTVHIDYALDARAVAYIPEKEGKKRAVIDFAVMAWSSAGKEMGRVSNTVIMHISPAELQQFLRTGVPADQELTLQPGDYLLRIGVIDRNTGRIGTLDVALNVPKS